jgi:hypothetical protein
MKKMRKIFFIVVGLIVIVVLINDFTKINVGFPLSSLVLSNKMKVDFTDFNPNDFEIVIELEDGSRTTVYKDNVYRKIPDGYGENDWTIIYKGEKQCKFGHFKTNWRNKHRYYIKLYAQDNEIYADVIIKGPDDNKCRTYKFTRLQQAAYIGKHIANDKSLVEGRLELLHYLKEQFANI